MYRCPKCNIELRSDARFCSNCGFNPAHVNLQTAMPQQAAQGNPPPTPASNQQKMGPPIMPMSPSPKPVELPQQSPTKPPEDRLLIPSRNKRNEQPRSLGISNKANAKSGNPSPAHSTPGNAEQAQPPQQPSVPPKPEKARATAEAAEKEQRFSLKQRYLSEQETGYQPSVENSPKVPAQPPVQPAPSVHNMQARSAVSQTNMAQQGIEKIPTTALPPPASATAHPRLAQSAVLDYHESESIAATSKAADHWHNSWRNRQRAEAGPAIGITRGQAVVPEPLMSMQNSIARMRAIIMPKNSTISQSRSRKLGFWITLTLLLCITGGLAAYIAWSYLPTVSLSAQAANASSPSPQLLMQSPKTSTIKAGQTLQVRGQYFRPAHAISFMLDTTPLQTASIESNSQGVFNATLAIPRKWIAGSSLLQAQDGQSGPHAFLALQILPRSTAMSNTTPLDLTIDDLPIPTTGMVFKTTIASANSAAQRITLTNNDTIPAPWSVAVVADNNLSWLLINDGKTSGNLDIAGTDSVGISVNSIGLKSSTKPYTGRVIFTTGKTQAIIPVSLFVQDSALEVVVNPNPIIAYTQAGGTCKPTTLTLINLSNRVVTWNANPFDVDKPHIHLDNQPSQQGTLDPSGLPNDTKALNITCIGAQVGEKLYHINVFYNSIEVNVPISIRNG